MQGFHRWHPPSGILGALVERAHERAAALREQAGALHELALGLPVPPDFAAALRRPDVAVIAEVKRRSPSRGEINGSIRAGHQAAAYVAGGASALSVLTEPDRFGGSPADLAEARARVAVPLLRKDFIVDEAQIAEARTLGASAVLLIARALPPSRVAELVAAATDLGLTPLVEIRDEVELAVALDARALVLGVNNRNLETLEVDAGTAARIIPHIPRELVAIAESGIADRAQVEAVAAAGADAVLCGSAVSAAADPTAAVRALVGVARDGAGRQCRT